MLLRDTSGCVYKITLNNEIGKVTVGLSDDYYMEEFKGFSKIISTEDFTISNKDSLVEINEVIKEISSETPKDVNTLVDTRRMEFFVGNEKKIDTYNGWRDENMKYLLISIAHWVKEINYLKPCK